MNLGLVVNNQEQLISSMELAELCGKRHDNVMRDIKKMEPAYIEVFGQALKFELSLSIKQLPNGGSKKLPCYNLTKSQSLFVVSSYNAVIRAMVQKRWEELEAKQPPRTFAQALRLAAEQAEKIEALQLESSQKEIEIKAKDYHIDNLIQNFISGLTITETMKQFNGVSLRGVIQRLIGDGFLKKVYKWKDLDGVKVLETGLTFTGKSKGWFQPDIKQGEIPKYKKDGTEFYLDTLDLYVTALGLKKLYNRYTSDKLPMVKAWDGEYRYTAPKKRNV